MEKDLIEDQLEKCRCCFRILIDKTIKISKIVEERFFDLCQVPLIINEAYSNEICELCDRDLRNFHYLKKDFTSKQKRLYELIPNAACEDSFIIEALDDVLLENPKKLNAREAASEAIVKTRKYSRKPKTILPIDDLSVTKKTFECEECNVSLQSKVSLKRHVERVHKKVRNFHCDLCSYSAFFKHSLEKHIVKHIPEEFRDRFQCDFCDFISISSVNIMLHKKYEHGEMKKSHVCGFEGCKKEFSRPGQLKAHFKLTHEKIKEKICVVCKKAFSTTTRLKEHVSSAHSNSNVREFSCEFCSKDFITLRALKNHLVYHEKPQFHCQMGCQKSFYKSVLLEGHHKTHRAQKDFECPFENCDQKYFLKSHLSRHIQSYHDKVKINCVFCESKFVRKETYRSHLLSHHQDDIPKPELDVILKKIRTMKMEKI